MLCWPLQMRCGDVRPNVVSISGSIGATKTTRTTSDEPLAKKAIDPEPGTCQQDW